MATIDDVEQGVCNALAGVLFPGSAYLAGSVATAVAPWIGSQGAPTLSIQAKLYIGEPVTEGMESDIRAGVSNIGVMRVMGATRNVTMFRPKWMRVSANTPTVQAAISGNSVVFGGAGGTGMVCGLTVSDVCYAYRTGPSDTPASIAAAFAAMLPGGQVAGAVVYAPGITAAQVVADQTAFWRTGQKETLIQVAIIAVPFTGADGPLVRASITRLVYGIEAMARADGSLNRFIGLPDGTTAYITGADERDDDTTKRNDMWRRWVTFRLLYDIGITQTQTTTLAPLLMLNANASRIFWAGNGAPVSGVLTDGAGNVLGDGPGNLLGTL